MSAYCVTELSVPKGMHPAIIYAGVQISSGGGRQIINAMKKIAVLYTVTLGIFWEAVYVMIIIGVGSLFALATQYIR